MPRTKGLNADEAIDVLWRDGYVPQWIDVLVVGETGETTILDVIACGRFIDDERRLYYTWTDVAPFGVKGPWLPHTYVKGARFSVYHRSSCWALDDLEHVHANAGKVWSLELNGLAFDDAALLSLRTIPGLEILELRGVPLKGTGLAALERLPRLRVLRASLDSVAELSFSDLPRVAALEILALRFLPPRLLSLAHIVGATPNLKDLTLAATDATDADDRLELGSLDHLTLEFPSPPAWVGMPKSLRGLSLHAPDATDEDVIRTLSACPDTLESLDLRNTPASDRVFDELERQRGLKYLDVVGTPVTIAALERFAERRPGFRCLPRLKSESV